jgi:uncharacterized membrane protein
MTLPKRHRIIIWLCILYLVFPLGCVPAAKRIPPKELGSIAVVHTNFTPEIMLDKPAKGWLAGAGRGSVNWMGKVFSWPFTQAGPPICTGQGCGLALLMVLALTTSVATIGGMAGGVVGAVKAEPAKKVDEAENIIKEAIAKLKIQETFRNHVAREAQQDKRGRFTILEGYGPTSLDQKATYRNLADRGIETILQISIVRIGLIGKWEVNPQLQLEMAVQVKIIRARDDKELYSDIFLYTGKSRKFSEWCADNAQALNDELEQCYSVLAEDIIAVTAADNIQIFKNS